MRLIVLTEELSMAELLKIILPKVLPKGSEPPLVIPHNGKRDLEKSIPRKLRAWESPDDKFIIVHDQDSSDCHRLKANLLSLCGGARNDYLVRIVCDELEAWYFGDLAAVSKAYGRDCTKLAAKRKYRQPDAIVNAKSELRKVISDYQPIDGAVRIAKHMDIDRNTSPSFNVFINGVRSLCDA